MVGPRIPDGDALIGAHWPVDGPHSPEALAAAMSAVTELIRYARHALRSPAVRLGAPQLYTVCTRLGAGLAGLPLLLAQLADAADAVSADPALRHDNLAGRGDAGVIAAVAADTVRDAAAEIGAAARAVAVATTDLGHLYHDDPARGA